MSLNNRTTIAGSRRVYRKACIRLSKCACGKTDRGAASLNKNYSKIPCGDSQTAQLSSQRPRVAEGSYPENETTEKNDEDNGRRRGGGGPTKRSSPGPHDSWARPDDTATLRGNATMSNAAQCSTLFGNLIYLEVPFKNSEKRRPVFQVF